VVVISQVELGESQLDTIHRASDELVSARDSVRIGLWIVWRVEDSSALDAGLVDVVAATPR